MNEVKKDEKGFTLVELMASLFLFSLMMVILMQAVSGSVEKTSMAEESSREMRAQQNVTHWMEKDMREHRIVDVRVEGERLVLEKRDGDWIEYEVRGEVLYREDGKGVMKLAEVEENMSVQVDEEDGEIIWEYRIPGERGFTKTLRIDIE